MGRGAGLARLTEQDNPIHLSMPLSLAALRNFQTLA